MVLNVRGSVTGRDGRRWTARVHGRRRDDGLLEGWLVFVSVEDGTAIRTERETTQSRLEHLAYWAGGLSRTYLEGALDRAERRAPRPRRPFVLWSMN